MAGAPSYEEEEDRVPVRVLAVAVYESVSDSVSIR